MVGVTDRRPDRVVTLNEIFYSIQGESTFAGRPCVFVRLAACDIRCSWCDTPYAFTEGRKVTIDEVVRDVLAMRCPLVEITGGEPLLQESVYPLMDRLLAGDKIVLLETGGHLSLERVPPAVIRILDVKCPGSGEAAGNDWGNLDRLTPHDQVKFVLVDRADYEFARSVLHQHDLSARCAAVLLSPAHGLLDPASVAAWMLEDHLPARLQLQQHKYVWGPETRGV